MKRKNNRFRFVLAWLLTIALSSVQVRGADYNQVEQVIDIVVPLLTDCIDCYGLYFWLMEMLELLPGLPSQAVFNPDYAIAFDNNSIALNNIGHANIQSWYGQTTVQGGISLFEENNFEVLKSAILGDLEPLRELLDTRVSIDTVNRDGLSALLWVAIRGQEAVTKLLLDAGADVNFAQKVGGMTALMWAAGGGHDATVKLLLEAGANIHAVDNGGLTALDWAIKQNNVAIVNMLEEAEAKKKQY